MFITARHSKVNAFLFQQTSLPRACNDDHLIKLSLKRCLSNRGYVDKQVIRPGLVYRALAKLVEVNPLHQNIQLNMSGKMLVRIPIQNYGIYSLMRTISMLKVKLMIVMRILKEMIMLMKKRCEILFCFYQLFCIPLKVHQYLLLKSLTKHQVKVKFLFLSQLNLFGKH